MNPRLQLLVKAKLERLLKAGFIKHVKITDWIFPMYWWKKRMGS
jgi:flagellar basal body-associated protein FliL